MPSKTICFDEDILLRACVCVRVYARVSSVWKFHIWFPFIASILPKRRICHFVECIIMRCLSIFPFILPSFVIPLYYAYVRGLCEPEGLLSITIANKSGRCLLKIYVVCWLYALYQCQCYRTYIQVRVDVFLCAVRAHKNE